MKDLRLLSPGGMGIKPHDHIVYLDSDRNGGLVTFDDGHTHELQYVPAVDAVEATEEIPEQIDPNTGELLQPGQPANPGQPATPEQWIVVPSEDGHTHEVLLDSELPRKAKSKKPDDSEILSEQLRYFNSALETEGKSLEDAEESEGFYTGEKQWTPREKQYLVDRGRACLTINETAKEINNISGNQRQTRTDFRCVPVGGTDQKVCDILNILIKNVTEQCFYEREESKVFLDSLIAGRGLFNIYIDKSRNPEGDIIIERLAFGDCKFGEHEKEDVSDAEFLVKDKMYSLGRLKATYEELEDDLAASFDQFLNQQPVLVSEDKSKDAYLQPNKEVPVPMMSGGMRLVDVERKEMRQIDLWRKKYVKVPVIVNADVDFYYDGFGISKRDLKRILSMQGFYTVDRVIPKMVISRTAGSVVLEYQDPAQLPTDDFHVVPVYCNKRGNRFWGKVHEIKDPQREINKRHSQAVDIGNRASGSGWLYDASTFASKKEEDDFLKNSSSPGFAAKVSDINHPPVQVKAGDMPPTIVQLLTLAHEHLKSLVNTTAMPNGANESNAMFTYRQKLLSAGNEYLTDNLRFAKIKVGRLLIATIQDLYTPERVYRTLVDADSRNPQGEQVGGIPVSEFTEEDVERLFRDNDLTKVDVVVTEGVYSPSVRMSIFAVLSDLKAAGADIPLELLFEFADIPQTVKDQVLQILADSAAAASQEQKEKSMTELWKTAMGKGYLPPEVVSKMSEALGVDMSMNGAAPPQNNTQGLEQ